jgi:CheY-like chemotaxis protein
MPMMNILVVDDQPDNLLLMSKMIGLDIDSQITTALSGREAIDLVREGHDFDLIVCDYQMPEMNGYDVFQELQKEGSEAFFLLCTNMDFAQLPRFSGSRFVGVIQKMEVCKLCDKLGATTLMAGKLAGSLKHRQDRI